MTNSKKRKKFYPPLTERLRSVYSELTRNQRSKAVEAFATHFKITEYTVKNKLYGSYLVFEVEIKWLEKYVENIKSPVEEPVTT